MSSITGAGSGGGGVGVVRFLQGDTGGPVGPNPANIIFTVGGNNITVAGNAGTFTETFSVSGTTNHAVQVGNASGSLTSLAVGTTGQVLTGVTGADPVFAAPAASSISITGDSGGALTGNSFTFTGGTTGLTFSGAVSTETLTGTLVVANGGSGRTSATAYAVICGGTGSTTAHQSIASVGTAGQVLTSNGAGALPTFQAASGGGLAWSTITANQTASVNNGYFINKAGVLTLALPAASAVGDTIVVYNQNTAAGMQFTQAAGQQIFIGNTNTTAGAAGTLTSTALGDSLTIVCSTANLTWRVISGWGNWTPA